MAKYYGAAAEYNKPTGINFNRRIALFLLLGVIALVFVSGLFVIIKAIGSGPANEAASLNIRTQRLQTFISAQQKKIKNDDLSKINSDATLLITSDSTSFKEAFTDTYGQFEYPPEIISAENDTESPKKLEQAALINQFDQQYVSILRDKIASTMSLARQVQNSGESSSIKTSVKTLQENLQTIDTQIAKLRF